MNRFDKSPAPSPFGAAHGSSADLTGFGFDLPDDDWLGRVRSAERRADLGRIGDYELLEEISRGAQGVVYRARQPNTQRVIALKRLIAGSLSSSEVRARFEREVHIASDLNHPNIVTVYGSEIVDGQPNLAMEWIDGEPIDRWAHNKAGSRRSVTEVARLFATICDAVHHAHQRGVIHRDLKPSNILVDAAGHPHILDFGLAKVLTTDDSQSPHLTRTQGFVGTPAYASPEQVIGHQAAVDVRSDVYSLGVILFQMLTGHLPYSNADDLAETLQSIKDGNTRRPSSLDARLNREIDAIVLKALAREPAMRYASVDGLAADVRRYLAREPVLAHPPTMIYQLRKLVGRHRLPFALAAVLAILVVGFGIVTAFLSIRLNEQRDAAVVAAKQEADAREAAEEVNDFLRRMLAAANPGKAQGRDVTVSEIVDQAITQVDASFENRPEVEAAVRLTLGETLYGLGRHAEAQQQFERSLSLMRERHGDDHSQTAQVRQHLANALRAQGRLDDAIELYEAAAPIFRADPAEQARLASTLDALASACLERNDFDRAEKLLLETQAVRAALPDANPEETVRDALLLSSLQFHRGDFGAAEVNIRDALQLARSALGDRHELTVVTLSNLAVALKKLERPSEALPYLEECLATSREVFGDDHTHTLQAMGNMASLLQALKRYPESEALYVELLQHHADVNQMDHPTAIAAASNLGSLLLEQKRYNEAEAQFRETLDRAKRVFGPKHSSTAVTMGLLAATLRDADPLTGGVEARGLLTEALANLEASLPPDHPHIQKTREQLADLPTE